MTGGIILLGLGPGEADLLTRQAWARLENVNEIYLRTRLHPAVAGLPGHLKLHSFDELYENGESLEGASQAIVEQVLALGRRPQGVVYAVPGHPWVADFTCQEIARRAQQEGLPVQVVDGLSFIEVTMTALRAALLPHTALVDALVLAAAHIPPFPPSVPALVAHMSSRAVASGVKSALKALYPDQHPVRLVHAAGTPWQRVEDLALSEIDHSPQIGLLTSLYIPPLGAASSFEAFQEVIARLRAPDGCPWDREQDHQTLRAYLLEETYELLQTLDENNPAGMQEELGDLLLQILLHAQIGAEYGEFTMADVLQGINQKIVYRHPHVFGDVQVEGAKQVVQNWEKLKAAEREKKGKAETSLLAGVAPALPALSQAEQYSHRAARVGFDWPAIEGVWDKLDEEIGELRRAAPEERSAELGDMLFVTATLARWFKVDPETALREANARFRRRFEYVDRRARQLGKPLAELSGDEIDLFWQEAKKQVG